MSGAAFAILEANALDVVAETELNRGAVSCGGGGHGRFEVTEGAVGQGQARLPGDVDGRVSHWWRAGGGNGARKGWRTKRCGRRRAGRRREAAAGPVVWNDPPGGGGAANIVGAGGRPVGVWGRPGGMNGNKW